MAHVFRTVTQKHDHTGTYERCEMLNRTGDICYKMIHTYLQQHMHLRYFTQVFKTEYRV